MTATTTPDAREIARQAVAEHLRPDDFDALRTEATARQRKREASESLPGALVRYSRAKAALEEHTETAGEAVALLDDLILAGGEPRSLEDRAVDLGAVLRDGIPPVDYLPGTLARRMVYAQGVTAISGHPKTGKTSLVARLAVDAMREGLPVVYFDYENGEREAARRFLAVGADADLLSAQLTYLPFPGPPDWSEIGALWDANPGALGVWDSTRGILRSLGLDEDKAADVGQFLDPLAEFAIHSRGVPMLLLDHVTKAANESTRYGRGSGDKFAAVQASWFLNLTTEFSESEVGEIELVRWGGRSGGLSARHRFEVGDGHGNLTFRRLDADESPEGRMEAAIIAYLRGRHPETASLRDVEENVSGTAAGLRDRVKALASTEGRPVAPVENGQHTRYAYVPGVDQEPDAVCGRLPL